MKKIILYIIIYFVSLPSITYAYYSDEQFRIDIMDSIRAQNLRQQQQDIMDSGNIEYQRSLDLFKSISSKGSACFYPVPWNETNISKCNEYQNNCDKYDTQMSIINSRTGSIYAKQSCDKAISCREEVKNYNKQMDFYNECLKTEKEMLLQDYQTRDNEREKAWKKEEAVMIKELELIRKENELKKREEAISKPTGSGIDLDQILKEADAEVEKVRKLEAIKNKNVTQPKPIKRKSLESIFSEYSDPLIPKVEPITNKPLKQTAFMRFKHTIKEVVFSLNPISWFKKTQYE